MNEPQLNFPVQLPLIDRDIEGEKIHQRPADGYVNATELCKVANKRLNDYLRLAQTREFLAEMSSVAGIPATEQNQGVTPLVYVVQGGDPSLQGTWVHPDVAINLAQWLSPKFAVRVSQWVNEWVAGNIKGYMPPHVRRYIANKSKIPPSHFSMINEVYLELLAPLDDKGIKIPSRMTPDISTGRMFSEYLRKKGLDPDAMPHYEHEFSDGRQSVQARMYPIGLLSEFRVWFQNEWMPKRAKEYFSERLPEAVPHIEYLLSHSTASPEGAKVPHITDKNEDDLD